MHIQRWNWVVSVLLLLALFPWPYAYYQMLRVIVFVAALVNAFHFHQQRQIDRAALFTAIAIIWNPVIPVHLPRLVWTLLDIGGAAAFFYLGRSGSSD